MGGQLRLCSPDPDGEERPAEFHGLFRVLATLVPAYARARNGRAHRVAARAQPLELGLSGGTGVSAGRASFRLDSLLCPLADPCVADKAVEGAQKQPATCFPAIRGNVACTRETRVRPRGNPNAGRICSDTLPPTQPPFRSQRIHLPLRRSALRRRNLRRLSPARPPQPDPFLYVAATFSACPDEGRVDPLAFVAAAVCGGRALWVSKVQMHWRGTGHAKIGRLA